MFRRSLSLPLQRSLKSILRQQVRYFDDEFSAQQSSLNLLSQDDEEGILIEAYSPLGFRLNNNIRVFGPCAVFPRSILHWNVASAADINEDSLSLFCQLEPKLDLLILGVGKSTSSLNKSVIRYLRSKKISVEILPTDHACSTFNFLNAEHRCVAAGLIPPEYQDGLGRGSASTGQNLVSNEMMGFNTGLFEIPKDDEKDRETNYRLFGENNENLWKIWYSNKHGKIQEESEKHDPNEHLNEKTENKNLSSENKTEK